MASASLWATSEAISIYPHRPKIPSIKATKQVRRSEMSAICAPRTTGVDVNLPLARNTGARVVCHGRQIAEMASPRNIFAEILRMIAGLRNAFLSRAP